MNILVILALSDDRFIRTVKSKKNRHTYYVGQSAFDLFNERCKRLNIN